MSKRIICLALMQLLVAIPAISQTAVTTSGGTINTVSLFSGSATIGNSVISQLSGNIGIGTSSPASLLSIGNGSPFQVDSSGNIFQVPSIPATSTANHSSPFLYFKGNYWNGSASAPDMWSIESTLDSTTNPASTLSFIHSGPLGGNSGPGISTNAPINITNNISGTGFQLATGISTTLNFYPTINSDFTTQVFASTNLVNTKLLGTGNHTGGFMGAQLNQLKQLSGGGSMAGATVQQNIFEIDAGTTPWGPVTINQSSLALSGASGNISSISLFGGQAYLSGTYTGTIANYYGLYLPNISGATNSYAIYSLGGQSYFAGNVGIGTPSPGAKLEVNGNLKVSGTGSGITFPDGSVQTSASSVGGGVITTSGSNVGIGTTTPSARLEVSGSLKLSSGASNTIIFQDGSSQATAGVTESTAASGLTNYLPKYSSATSLTNSAIAENSGKVGIGNSAPSGALDVVTTSDTTGNLSAFGPQHFVVGAGLSSGVGSGGVFTSYDRTNNRGYIGAVSPNVAWRNLILQPISGNVGIGVLSPVAPFQVGAVTAIQSPVGTQSALSLNTYYDGSAWRYISSGLAASLRMNAGNISFNTLPSGTSGATASTMDTTGLKMVLFNSGGLALGNSVVGTDPGAGNMNLGGSLHFSDNTSQTTAYAGTATSLPVSVTASSLTSVGTISAGTWHGSAVTSPYLPSNIVYSDSVQTISGQKTFTSYLGVGVSSPLVPLDVSGILHVSGNTTPSVGSQGAYLGWNAMTGGTGETDIINSQGGGSGGIAFMNGTGSGSPTTLAFLNGAGSLGIGTTTPSAKLEVNGNVRLTASSGSSITFSDNSVQTVAWNGILSGGDYAESVDVVGPRSGYEPGDVMVVDPSSQGHFLKSDRPYSTAVMGIYSTRPGVVGRRQPSDKSHMKEEVPMAMVGIVPTKVCAEGGAISPGDLLVTSSISGYAMRGTDRNLLAGAILGKALGRLDKGFGLIEVAVSLQ